MRAVILERDDVVLDLEDPHQTHIDFWLRFATDQNAGHVITYLRTRFADCTGGYAAEDIVPEGALVPEEDDDDDDVGEEEEEEEEEA